MPKASAAFAWMPICRKKWSNWTIWRKCGLERSRIWHCYLIIWRFQALALSTRAARLWQFLKMKSVSARHAIPGWTTAKMLNCFIIRFCRSWSCGRTIVSLQRRCAGEMTMTFIVLFQPEHFLDWSSKHWTGEGIAAISAVVSAGVREMQNFWFLN